MKRKKGILVFLLFIIVFQGYANNHVSINGSISGQNTPKEILYSNPVNGVCFTYGYKGTGLSDKAKIDSLGSFKIKVKTDKPVFLKIFLYNIPPLIIEPGKSYKLTIDSESKNFIFESVENKFAIHDIFQSWPMENPRRCDWLNSMSRDFQTLELLKGELNKEIYQLNELRINTLISNDIYELVKLERTVYYAVALNVIASDVVKSSIIENKEFPDKIFNAWGESYTLIDITDIDLIRATLAYDLIDYCFWYEAYSRLGVDSFLENRKIYREKGRIHSYTMSVAEDIFTGKILEFYKAGYIFFFLLQLQNDPELNLLLTSFTEKYPESNYTKFLPLVTSEK